MIWRCVFRNGMEGDWMELIRVYLLSCMQSIQAARSVNSGSAFHGLMNKILKYPVGDSFEIIQIFS